ncbi:ADP/ATP-dependent (S)-NAD(P)H-hydrate dehydratase [Microbacterium sp. CFBP9023]|uniref:ADP-dependent NAD(P)H-hydrate dehydratase n=1 Tax=Microbacterium sp. CFBP9023 TaxID=3096535 RepID=UPI002A6A00D8|nr:ADP/ATP-dependent (S)-NAD(P)H-hydrate dehydratase [Microbacterium sp. CFBP9023]MDY0984966.1 ADP/ATP-dependent (S)-NAD(P)H-hydrate dehydratase [Microbacterium sp. CFBP9023]
MSARDEPTRVTPQLLQEWGLPDPGDSKKSRGTAVIIGGSSLSAGAVVLGGEAMLRVGAGKVAVTTDASVADVVRIAFPEAGVYESPGPGEPMTDDLRSACEGADAVLVGPGLDDPEDALGWLRRLAGHDISCLVVDAFAVGALRDVPRSDLPASLIVNANLDEAELLLGRPVDDLFSELPGLAQELDAVIHCYSAVVSPSGAAWRLDDGGPGLGTAGSGDVVAGAITGFAARGLAPERAAVWGAWAHARAGDRLAERRGLGYLARELVRELPAAVLDADGARGDVD